MENSNGPSIEPWGMPLTTGRKEKENLANWTH